jgi:anti-sigma regulatory factor (Ser/Thr protein kinase)
MDTHTDTRARLARRRRSVAQHSPPTRPGDSTIRVSLSADPSAAASARGLLYAIEPALQPELMDDLRLLVSELVTNSVRHSGDDGGQAVELEVAVDASRIRVEVCDYGTGFEPRPRDADQTKPGGWGLYLVDRLTDRWGVLCNHVTRVWFEIDRSPQAGGSGI